MIVIEVRPVPVVILGCSASKAQGPAAALELYRGPLFVAARAWALSVAPRSSIWILSARYGLVRADARLVPYDMTIGQRGADLVDGVAAQAREFPQGSPVIFVGGAAYMTILEAAGVHARHLSACLPPGRATRGIGAQRAWLARHPCELPAAEPHFTQGTTPTRARRESMEPKKTATNQGGASPGTAPAPGTAPEVPIRDPRAQAAAERLFLMAAGANYPERGEVRETVEVRRCPIVVGTYPGTVLEELCGAVLGRDLRCAICEGRRCASHCGPISSIDHLPGVTIQEGGAGRYTWRMIDCGGRRHRYAAELRARTRAGLVVIYQTRDRTSSEGAFGDVMAALSTAGGVEEGVVELCGMICPDEPGWSCALASGHQDAHATPVGDWWTDLPGAGAGRSARSGSPRCMRCRRLLVARPGAAGPTCPDPECERAAVARLIGIEPPAAALGALRKTMDQAWAELAERAGGLHGDPGAVVAHARNLRDVEVSALIRLLAAAAGGVL